MVDTMLGKLAKWLRILGHDTAYRREGNDTEFIAQAKNEGRWIITRDRLLIKRRGLTGFTLIRDNDPKDQLRQIVTDLALDIDKDIHTHLFTRCIECNGEIHPLSKEGVKGRVPEYVYAVQAEFSCCPRCRRIYWGGTHRKRVREGLEGLFLEKGQR